MFNIFKKIKEEKQTVNISPYKYPSKYTHYKDYEGDSKLKESLSWQEVLRISKLQREQVAKLTHKGANPQ